MYKLILAGRLESRSTNINMIGDGFERKNQINQFSNQFGVSGKVRSGGPDPGSGSLA
jgi:hypothetical protein